MSPPPLKYVILEGNLEFDDAATQELVLRCNNVLINGGSLSAGTKDVPFQANNANGKGARITL